MTYAEGDPTFSIEVDVADYTEADSVLQLFVKAVLSDYSALVQSALSAEFEIEILAVQVEEFVFVPPPPPSVTETAPEPPAIEPEVEVEIKTFVPVIKEPVLESDPLANELR